MTDSIERADVLDLCREWYPLVGGDVCDWTKFEDAIRSIPPSPAAGTGTIEELAEAIVAKWARIANPVKSPNAVSILATLAARVAVERLGAGEPDYEAGSRAYVRLTYSGNGDVSFRDREIARAIVNAALRRTT